MTFDVTFDDGFEYIFGICLLPFALIFLFILLFSIIKIVELTFYQIVFRIKIGKEFFQFPEYCYDCGVKIAKNPSGIGKECPKCSWRAEPYYSLWTKSDFRFYEIFSHIEDYKKVKKSGEIKIAKNASKQNPAGEQKTSHSGDKRNAESSTNEDPSHTLVDF